LFFKRCIDDLIHKMKNLVSLNAQKKLIIGLLVVTAAEQDPTVTDGDSV
jgi:hypothetical protein